MLSLGPMPPEDHSECARIMASSDPWLTLGRGFDVCLAILQDETRERYVARTKGSPGVAGFLILNLHGAFAGYVQTVCVAAEARGRGIGSVLMRFAEERIFRDSPNVFLCVSSFNERARSLYERRGYALVGDLPDYIARGHAEILMRKSIGSLDEFRERAAGGAVPVP